MKKKILAVVLAVVVLAVAAVGATLAWLMDTSDTVVNTFTLGNVSISLSETITNDNGEGGNAYQLIPGNTYAKDPKVTVTGDSEACWLFIKVDEAGTNAAAALEYAVRNDWTQLTVEQDDGEGGKINVPVAGVYYREVAASEDDQSFYVLAGGADDLANGQITIRSTLTSDQMTEIQNGTVPSLAFTAYAIQKDNVANANTAWTEIQAVVNPEP